MVIIISTDALFSFFMKTYQVFERSQEYQTDFLIYVITEVLIFALSFFLLSRIGKKEEN